MPYPGQQAPTIKALSVENVAPLFQGMELAKVVGTQEWTLDHAFAKGHHAGPAPKNVTLCSVPCPKLSADGIERRHMRQNRIGRPWMRLRSHYWIRRDMFRLTGQYLTDGAQRTS